MTLLLQLAFSTVLAAGADPAAPIALEPDSSSVALTAAAVQPADPFSSYDDALAFLMGEHQLSVAFYYVQSDTKSPVRTLSDR